MFGQQVISGLATGSLYALTAVAVVVVFRNTRTINLAQGDFAMIGAFLAVILIKDFGANYYLALAGAVVGCIGLGILVERLVMRQIADSDWLTLFTATLGMYYILHGVAGHVERAVGARAVLVVTDGRGCNESVLGAEPRIFAPIESIGVELVTPGELSGVAMSSCGLLPLRLRGQPFAGPAAVRVCVVP